MTTRCDGSQFPDGEADDAVLREDTDPNCETGPGFAYNRTIADLLIDMLVGRHLAESGDSDPENWESVEHAMLVNAGLEIKAINAALADSTTDMNADDMTVLECSTLLRALGRRVEAGAELAQRLRAARWGHPAFGGGEGWEAKVNAKKAESAKEAKAANG